MARTPRRAEEVEEERERILAEALKIIATSGYDGLTMRGLGQRLGMAAKTIYNYFRNKDEVYLQVATKEFRTLHDELLRGYESSEDPSERLRAMTERFLALGLARPSHYDMLFSLRLPRYRDFFDSPAKDLAARGLATALNVRELIERVMREIAGSGGDFSEEEIVLRSVAWLTGMHGILSLHNNGILSYLHDRPDGAVAMLAERHLRSFEPEAMKRSSPRSLQRGERAAGDAASAKKAPTGRRSRR